MSPVGFQPIKRAAFSDLRLSTLILVYIAVQPRCCSNKRICELSAPPTLLPRQFSSTVDVKMVGFAFGKSDHVAVVDSGEKPCTEVCFGRLDSISVHSLRANSGRLR